MVVVAAAGEEVAGDEEAPPSHPGYCGWVQVGRQYAGADPYAYCTYQRLQLQEPNFYETLNKSSYILHRLNFLQNDVTCTPNVPEEVELDDNSRSAGYKDTITYFFIFAFHFTSRYSFAS